MTKKFQSLTDELSQCPKCGEDVIITHEISNPRFIAQCKNDKCQHINYRLIRASALTLPGILQLGSTIAISIGVFIPIYQNVSFKTGFLFGGISLLIGGVIVRFVYRFIAICILHSNTALGLKEEMIAYLAPPPWKQPNTTTQPDS